jgi:hypothetical protein
MPFPEKIQEWRDRPFRVSLYPFGVTGRGAGNGNFGASNRTKLPTMKILKKAKHYVREPSRQVDRSGIHQHHPNMKHVIENPLVGDRITF